MKYYLLANPKSGDSTFMDKVSALEFNGAEKEIVNVLEISDYTELIGKLGSDDKIVICGGDGSLNQFVNRTQGIEIKNEILMYSAGTGNDFLFDIGADTIKDGPIPIGKYLVSLPSVEVNGKKYKFINGVGYGIDGYCCEEGDRQKAAGVKKISYSSIAIKGILGKFSSRNAKVTVDGKEYLFKKVWLAPTMNGRAYGGGMLVAPEQDRLNPEHTISVVIFKSRSRLNTLMIFPSFFKGTHVKKKKNITILTGKRIEVEFDKPTPLQIDGEVISGVTSYTAVSAE